MKNFCSSLDEFIVDVFKGWCNILLVCLIGGIIAGTYGWFSADDVDRPTEPKPATEILEIYCTNGQPKVNTGQGIFLTSEGGQLISIDGFGRRQDLNEYCRERKE